MDHYSIKSGSETPIWSSGFIEWKILIKMDQYVCIKKMDLILKLQNGPIYPLSGIDVKWTSI